MVPLPLRVTTDAGGPIPGGSKKGPKLGPPAKVFTPPTTRWETFDLSLTCTFEGMRTREQRPEALISLVGRVQGRGANAKKTLGDVSGVIALDMQAGFISFAQIKTWQDIDSPNDDLTIGIASEIELNRSAGNPLNIQMPPESKTNPGQAKSDPSSPIKPKPELNPKIDPNPKGKILFNFPNLTLQPTDFPDTSPRGKTASSRMKVMPLTFQAGKTYEITVSSNAFIPLVRVEDSNSKLLTDQAQKGANPSTRVLTYTATANGVHRVVVTNAQGKTGPFSILVQEK
jgi:hypothetical protein